jgi:hypothetical protein
MSQFGEKLGRKKQAAVLALVSSRDNVEEAARLAGVTPRTVYRWKTQPAFDSAYREAKRAVFLQAIERLHQMAGAAVVTLGKVMTDPNTPPATKLRAADSILGHIKNFKIGDGEAQPPERAREVTNVDEGDESA